MITNGAPGPECPQEHVEDVTGYMIEKKDGNGNKIKVPLWTNGDPQCVTVKDGRFTFLEY